MANAGYRIIDEPPPSRLKGAIANPFWIVIAGMLLMSRSDWVAVLVLLALAFNSFALGGPTRNRELAWVAGGLAILAAFAEPVLDRLVMLTGNGLIPFLPYLFILKSALALTVLFRIHLYQIGTYRLHRYLSERPS